MSIKPVFHLLAVVIVLGSATVHAASGNSLQARKGSEVDEAALIRAQGKFTQAMAVVQRFDATAKREGYINDEWRRELLANLMQADEATRASVAAAADLAEAMGRSREAARTAPAVSTNFLGSSTSDLTFIPITPCRILDTRAGAVLNAGVTYTYSYNSTNVGAGNCSVHTGALDSPVFYPAAEAVNVTVDESGLAGFPNGSFLAIFPQGSVSGTSFLNFGPGQILANAGVVSLNAANGQFSILTNANANVIIDVYGMFASPLATALDCTDTAKTTGTITANGNLYLTAAACPADYAAVGGSCFGGVGQSRALQEAVMSATSHWVCRFQDFSGTSYELAASTRCCRVPGR